MTRLLLTGPEAAEALAISRSKLYELIAADLIRSVRIDGSRPGTASTSADPQPRSRTTWPSGWRPTPWR